jgi:TM2 domain-containing membrane protein YozV
MKTILLLVYLFFFLPGTDIHAAAGVPEAPAFSYDSSWGTAKADSVRSHRHENKKLIAAVLAFPLPFGFLGLHRIYLGTKPYMPFAYVGTIGGCFGILPLIDFITILTTKKEKLKAFENNPRIFMWVH